MDSKEEVDVLIVDDDASIRSLLCVAISRLGLHCHTAVDGEDALEKVTSSEYAVILLDLMMPRIDGREFVARLCEFEKTTSRRPVIVMMTAFPASERLPVPDTRVHLVVRKPFDVVALSELVSDCVKVSRRRTAVGSRSGASHRASPSTDFSFVGMAPRR